MDAPRHPVGGVRNGLVGKMGVALRGLDQGMTEQLGDGHHVHAVHRGDRSPAMPNVMNPQSGQARFVADAVPLVLEVVDVPRRRTRRKQKRAIGAVARDGADDRARGARQPDRAWPGLRIGKVDALAANPVPFEGDDFAEAASGQHQQADDGDGLRAIELIAGEHGVEPGHLLGGEKSRLRLHPVSLGVLAGVGVVGAIAPKLGHAHHDGQDRHGAVGATGPVGHGREPILDVLDGDGVDGEMAEGGQDVLAHHVGVGLQGPGFPVPGVAVEGTPRRRRPSGGRASWVRCPSSPVR